MPSLLEHEDSQVVIGTERRGCQAMVERDGKRALEQGMRLFGPSLKNERLCVHRVRNNLGQAKRLSDSEGKLNALESLIQLSHECLQVRELRRDYGKVTVWLVLAEHHEGALEHLHSLVDAATV